MTTEESELKRLRAGLESIRERAADGARVKKPKGEAELMQMVASDCYAILHGNTPPFSEAGDGQIIAAAFAKEGGDASS
jgi:hypothetical protein